MSSVTNSTALLRWRVGLALGVLGGVMTSAAIVTAQYPWASYHASTAEEGLARGMANLVWAAGEANLRNSQAAINYEQARSANFDNRLKATETYFEMRKMNKAYRDAEKSPPASTQDLYRWAKEGAPKRLTPTELDPLTGEINWSVALLGNKYTGHRQKLDDLFASRATHHGRLTQEQHASVRDTTMSFLNDLKNDIRAFAPNDYLAARKMLESLAYEASQPMR